MQASRCGHNQLAPDTNSERAGNPTNSGARVWGVVLPQWGPSARGKSHSGCERVFCPVVHRREYSTNRRTCLRLAPLAPRSSILDPEQNSTLSLTKHFLPHHGLLLKCPKQIVRYHAAAIYLRPNHHPIRLPTISLASVLRANALTCRARHYAERT